MKISVIVPVYNVEKYVGKCLDSIINQSYHDLEIIIVDDGSTDESPKICNEFAITDQRIKLIHQNNRGVSIARNTGLKQASGEYVAFVDSDDWLEPSMYENMVLQIRKMQDLDVVMCDSVLISPLLKVKATEFIRKGHYSNSQIVAELYPVLIVTENFEKIPIVSACTSLIKRNLLIKHNIRFEGDLKYGEDYLFMAQVIICSVSYYYLKDHFYYNYRQYNESRSKKLQADWWSNLLTLNKKLKELLADSSEFDFARQLKLQLIHSALFLSNAIINNGDIQIRQKVKMLRRLFNELELKKSFSNLELDKQLFTLRVVLFLMKRKMAFTFLIYRILVSKVKFI